MKQAGTKNPVFLLDEVDKLGASYQGDPSSALLEVLDPAQNDSFTDHYLGVPFDLSEVLFIATSNFIQNIPGPLLDRMEVVDFSRLHRAREGRDRQDVPHSAPARGVGPRRTRARVHRRGRDDGDQRVHARKRRAAAGAPDRRGGAQGGAPRGHGRHRDDRRQGASAPRKCASCSAARRCIRSARPSTTRWASPPACTTRRWAATSCSSRPASAAASSRPRTDDGHDAVRVGPISLILTGQLGDVMKESARAALTYATNNAESLGIPRRARGVGQRGAHPRAGGRHSQGRPAARASRSRTALVSEMSNRKVRRDVAMTGEITLRGRVLPIGGVKEKVLGAHRAGITRDHHPQGQRGGSRGRAGRGARAAHVPPGGDAARRAVHRAGGQRAVQRGDRGVGRRVAGTARTPEPSNGVRAESRDRVLGSDAVAGLWRSRCSCCARRSAGCADRSLRAFAGRAGQPVEVHILDVRLDGLEAITRVVLAVHVQHIVAPAASRALITSWRARSASACARGTVRRQMRPRTARRAGAPSRPAPPPVPDL